jgi:hypothetical protein
MHVSITNLTNIQYTKSRSLICINWIEILSKDMKMQLLIALLTSGHFDCG